MSHHPHDPERCRELLAQINAYVDGELAAAIRRDLERHLAACPDCRTVCDSLATLVALYRSLGAASAELPAGVEERLLRRLKGAGA